MGINNEVVIEARKMLCVYLYEVAKGKGISTYDIARETGLKQPNVHRIFTGKYSPSLDNLIKIGDAVGVYFFMIDKEHEADLVKVMQKRWQHKDESN